MVADQTGSGGGRAALDALPPQSLRLLLVEDATEEGGGARDGGRIARSLAMDAAYAMVSGSSTPCRGPCSTGNNDDGGEGGGGRTGRSAASGPPCRCCRVALLVPGEPKRRSKRKRGAARGAFGDSMKIDFPLPCSRDGTEGHEGSWDQALLDQIQIKYVTSLEDAVRYLVYSASLPDHLQPLDGIFLLGVGELLSRQNNAAMELTHLCECKSCIAVTGYALASIVAFPRTSPLAHAVDSSFRLLIQCPYSQILQLFWTIREESY